MNANSRECRQADEQITIGVRVSAETHAKLVEIAKKQERSISALLRIAIKDTLAEAERLLADV